MIRCKCKCAAIGLTGGLGMGKSTVLKLFAKYGLVVLDADKVAHDVVAPGQDAYRKIVKFFGPDILRRDRTIDRATLAGIVFADPGLRRALERIVHPPVIRQIKSFLRICKGKGSRQCLCAVSVPLLFEAGLQRMFDTVVVVNARRQEVFRRLGKSRNMTPKEILSRMKAQMPLKEKCKRADFVLDNNGSLGHLARQVRDLLKKVCEK